MEKWIVVYYYRVDEIDGTGETWAMGPFDTEKAADDYANATAGALHEGTDYTVCPIHSAEPEATAPQY